MSHEIRPDYETRFLFPPSLEDWVGADHPARFIREFVDALDVSELGLTEDQQERRADPNGRPHYAVDVLLKLWLYAYMNRIRSSRALEAACRDSVALIWLAGRLEPDHNTLWRFWSRYRQPIRQAFLMSVRVAMRANLVGMVLNAVDGTKITSRASRRTAWHESDLLEMLGRIDKDIERLEQQIQEAGGESGPDDRLPEQLQKRQELRSRIKESLDVLRAVDREHMHPQDPDAQMMVGGRGTTEFAYNAQAVVDAEQGVIVAADVTDEATDKHQLVPMLEETENNIGRVALTTVGDSGYHSGEALASAEAMGADVLIAMPRKLRKVHEYHALHFRYDETTDAVTCPRGELLPREGTKRHRQKPSPIKTYRCRTFGTCPAAAQCSSDPKGRLIEIGPHQGAVDRNRNHTNARALLKRRQAIVERAFAEIKEVLGLRRWSAAGLQAVKTQWTMACAAMNLRRILAHST
jgi:transposase